MKTKHLSTALLAVALSLTLGPPARATVTNVAWYRLGENDPGALPGLAATNSIDVVSNRVLTLAGGPQYDANVALAAVHHVESSLGVRFSGATWGTNALVSTLVDNFGLELWVNPSVLAGDHMLAYNGHTGSSGWGLNLANGIYSVLIGGKAVVGSAPAASNVWVHLALVRNAGTTTFYTNGVAVATSAATPNVPAGLFGVANAPNPPGTAVFEGALDEVRVFTFAAGQFSTNDLLLNRPIIFGATTTAPSGLTTNTAVLNGIVNPAGQPTAVWFEWGPYTPFGAKTDVISLPATNGPVAISRSVSGLIPGLAYHYRLVASNATKVWRGRARQFWAPVLRVNGNNPMTLKQQRLVDPWGATVQAAPIGLAAGFHSSLALKGDGTIVTWGSVGPNNTKVVAIAAGLSHFLALKGDGTVIGWGDNSNGQTTIPPSATNVVAISGGALHSLALRADGTVVGWGYNAYGQANTPVEATNVIAISAGYFHSMALKADGTVFGWGYNPHGETIIPPQVTNVVALAAGYFHNLALRADGALFAWGWNNVGQTDIPPSATDLVAIAPGGYHSLALKADGTVVGWGSNGMNQVNIPASATNVVALAGGYIHNLALRANGSVFGWGGNSVQATNPPPGLDVVNLPVASANNVNTNVLGSYEMNYFVTNGYGIVATANRTVLVIDSPTIAVDSLSAMVIGTNSIDGRRIVRFSASVNPNGSSTLVWIGYGLTTGYGAVSDTNLLSGTFTPQPTTIDVLLSPGFTWHWRVAAANGIGTIPGNAFSADQIFVVPPPGAPGDLNGDGFINPNEFAGVLANLNSNGVISTLNLEQVVSNYLAHTSIHMDNVTGLGSRTVNFALANSASVAFSVEVSTNLVDWQFLGPAVPRYLFTDPEAPAAPRRYYRLRYP